ncbi:MAG: hypothetical protein ACM3WV_07690, partial [Bacillota bacterium]
DVKYDIKMEYYENGGGAVAKLSWSSASQAKEIIPQSRLYPATGVIPTPTPTPTIIATPTPTTSNPPEGSITIDRNTKYQTIEGFGFFGGQGAWWDSDDPNYFYSTPWLDLMFNNLGSTMWRNELYPHIPVTANNGGQDAYWDKQRPCAQAIANYCNTNNIPLKILLSVWSPPAAYKCLLDGDQNFLIGQEPDGTRGGNVLDPTEVTNFRNWLVSGLQMYKDAGLNVYAMSFQNEPYFWEPYNSCFYYQDRADHYDYHTFSQTVNPGIRSFTNNNGTHPLTFGSENMLGMEGLDINWQWFYHQNIMNDATALANLDRWAVHGYTDGVQAVGGSEALEAWQGQYNHFTQPSGKPCWQTEISGFDPSIWLDNGSQQGSFAYGLSIQLGLIYGKVAAWVFWQGTAGSAPGIYNMTGYNLSVGKTFYASKQFYRYIRPGARMVSVINGNADLYVSAFEHTGLNNFVIVLVNNSTNSKTISITGSNLPGSYTGYRSSSSENCANIGTVYPSSVTVPGKSILTLVNGDYTE